MQNSFCDKCQKECKLKQKEDVSLCKCCEDQCIQKLKKFRLAFKNFDKYKNDRKKRSVDALFNTQTYLFLIEIKNQPTSNIKPMELDEKIKNTLEDLQKRGCNLEKQKQFFLSIPEEKLTQTPKHTPPSGKLDFYKKIGNEICNYNLDRFMEGKIYTTKIANQEYRLKTHIISCQNLENYIIKHFTNKEKKLYINKNPKLV